MGFGEAIAEDHDIVPVLLFIVVCCVSLFALVSGKCLVCLPFSLNGNIIVSLDNNVYTMTNVQTMST